MRTAVAELGFPASLPPLCRIVKQIGLSATAIASSFGKAISENKELEDYVPEDIARSRLRLISNNIGQIAHLNALLFGLKRILFGGFFIRGHEYTMDTISVAVEFCKQRILLRESIRSTPQAVVNPLTYTKSRETPPSIGQKVRQKQCF
ncbi:hypothetical protein Ancab_020495 [Ancistrocladus abbreviatus]